MSTFKLFLRYQPRALYTCSAYLIFVIHMYPTGLAVCFVSRAFVCPANRSLSLCLSTSLPCAHRFSASPTNWSYCRVFALFLVCESCKFEHWILFIFCLQGIWRCWVLHSKFSIEIISSIRSELFDTFCVILSNLRSERLHFEAFDVFEGSSFVIEFHYAKFTSYRLCTTEFCHRALCSPFYPL